MRGKPSPNSGGGFFLLSVAIRNRPDQRRRFLPIVGAETVSTGDELGAGVEHLHYIECAAQGELEPTVSQTSFIILIRSLALRPSAETWTLSAIAAIRDGRGLRLMTAT